MEREAIHIFQASFWIFLFESNYENEINKKYIFRPCQQKTLKVPRLFVQRESQRKEIQKAIKSAKHLNKRWVPKIFKRVIHKRRVGTKMFVQKEKEQQKNKAKIGNWNRSLVFLETCVFFLQCFWPIIHSQMVQQWKNLGVSIQFSQLETSLKWKVFSDPSRTV